MATQWFPAIITLLGLLCPWTIALPDPLIRAKLSGVIQSREVCYDDDVLWSFQYWSHDSVPYCSSLLEIQDRTITVDPVTSYTTTNIVVTTEYEHPTDTVTNPQVTVFSTTTTTVAHIWRRALAGRQLSCSPDQECAKSTDSVANTGNPTDVAIPFTQLSTITVTAGLPEAAPSNSTTPAPPLPEPTLIEPAPLPAPFTWISSTNPGPTPITTNPVPSILADCATNASVASFVFSACSCLRLKPKIVDITPTIQTTRTISGIDYEARPSVPGGTTTIIVTTRVLPPIVGSSIATSSSLSSGAIAPSGGVISSIVAPSQPIYSFHLTTATARPLTYFTPSSGLGPTSTGTGFPLPLPTAISTPGHMSIHTPSNSSLIAQAPATSPVPLSISGGNQGSFGVSSQTSALPSNGTKLSIGTTVAATVGTLSSNSPASASGPPSIILSNTTTLASSFVTVASTGIDTPQPSLLPIGTSIDPRGCPTINNTIYTDGSNALPQRYQIQCYREYTGPSYLGLPEPDLKHCIEECDKVNLGFSMLECYGVTWLAYSGNATSVRCLLKTQEGLGSFLKNTLSVSAVLLDVPPPIVGVFYPPPEEINGTWYPS